MSLIHREFLEKSIDCCTVTIILLLLEITEENIIEDHMRFVCYWESSIKARVLFISIYFVYTCTLIGWFPYSLIHINPEAVTLNKLFNGSHFVRSQQKAMDCNGVLKKRIFNKKILKMIFSNVTVIRIQNCQ